MSAKNILVFVVDGVKQLLMSTTMSGLTLIRGKILLTFMDAFEKQLYNAAHGSAVALPPPSKVNDNPSFRLQ